jgi:prefoldin subunit 5
MSEFFIVAWKTIAEYGQFPVGIIVGIYLARSAYNKALNYMNEEKRELRNEKKELQGTIEAQQQRIDILHDKIFRIEEKGEGK